VSVCLRHSVLPSTGSLLRRAGAGTQGCERLLRVGDRVCRDPPPSSSSSSVVGASVINRWRGQIPVAFLIKSVQLRWPALWRVGICLLLLAVL